MTVLCTQYNKYCLKCQITRKCETIFLFTRRERYDTIYSGFSSDMQMQGIFYLIYFSAVFRELPKFIPGTGVTRFA